MDSHCFWQNKRLGTEFEAQGFEIKIHRYAKSELYEVDLKKLVQKSFKVAFGCEILFKKETLWNWILGNCESILPTSVWRNLVENASKLFLSAHCFREKSHFETDFKLWEVEIGIESRMMNYCCHHSIEEIWSKALQSCF